MTTPINSAAVFQAISKRAEEMVEEKTARLMVLETSPRQTITAVGTAQDFKIKQRAIARARLREQRAAFRAANALLRAAGKGRDRS